MGSLVIVESPSKAKTINKYLGADYTVKASKGHVVDLPKSELAVDVEDKFKPKYVITDRKKIKELKDAYEGADKLILAVDLDREGEAIGWHVAQKLGAVDVKGQPKAGKKVERIVFSEITKDAIKEALNNPRSIDINLVNAQQSRRILDRLVGYKLSPLVWKKIRYGLSAGRVQSVALRLIVEREEERNAFVAEEYWNLYILANKVKGSTVEVIIKKSKAKEENVEEDIDLKKLEEGRIRFTLDKIDSKKANLTKEDNIKDILNTIKDRELVIKAIERKNVKKYPKPPFITSTLQQTAINRFGYSAKKTMMIAQKLYEAGHITYMRTDSLAMSSQAIEDARKTVKKFYGDKYLSPQVRVYKSKSKGAQEAHECIRPVNFTATANSLKLTNEESNIYNLIRNRSMATQMAEAVYEQMSIFSDIEQYGFKSTGSRIVFDGFLKLYGKDEEENELPDVKEGEVLYQDKLVGTQHFTQPPARYSEATLIKKLEELGIGRPSTYASIISTILNRNYTEKDGKYLFPTDTGKVVNRLLVKYFPSIVDYGFTAGMEEHLDEVAEGKLDWVKMLSDFYFPFEKQITENDKKISKDEFTVLGKAPEDIKCPECGSPMEIKLGRFGTFYSCSRFPECKGMLSMQGESKEDVAKRAEDPEFLKEYKPAPKTEDGRDYVLKKGRFGEFWAHPDYPKTKDIKSLEYTDEKKHELFGDAPKTDDGRSYDLKKGKFGFFWAHPDYPKVKDIKKVRKATN